MNNKTKPYRLASLLVPAAILLAPSAGAMEAILTQDAYVSSSQSATNFGAAETLPVGGGNRALLRFNLATMLPPGTVSSQVSKARLLVWVNGVIQAGSVEAAELQGNWTETGVTHATLPGVGAAFTTATVPPAGRWMPIVITDQVKAWLDNPNSHQGVVIAPAAAAPATSVTLDSKENTATSHAPRLEIELTGTLGGSYSLTVGKNAGDSTGRGQLAVADFTTLTEALNKIPSNIYSGGVCSARYLIKVLPGVYNERVTMKPCVDIEGSGELTTKITAAGGANLDANSSTVNGASEAELRFLTVANTGGSTYAIGLTNGQNGNGKSPRLTHITAIASGGTDYNIGVSNTNSSSPVMTNVTATASGGYYNYGVYNNASSPRMANVAATASGGTVNYGVSNHNSSSPAMTDVTATASGGTSNHGVYNNSSSPGMTNVTATASGGTYSYGVTNHFASPMIEHSVLSGATSSLYSLTLPGNGSNTAQVSASRLEGGAAVASGTATNKCLYSYNGSLVALNASCQ